MGSCSDQLARQSLRQALAVLRKDLRDSSILDADGDTVRLVSGLASVDALEFVNLSTSSRAADLQRAAELFQGDFLAGFSIEEEGFRTWLAEWRSRVHMAAARVGEAYAQRSDLSESGEQAVVAIERLLAHDPLCEDWQRLALRLYAR